MQVSAYSLPLNPRSNLKDAINDEVLGFYHLANGADHLCHASGLLFELYNAIQDKLVNRVQSVALVIDTRLLTTPLPSLSRELDELMVPVDIIRIDIQQGKHQVLSHERQGSYRPAGVVSQYREVTVHSLKTRV